MKSGTIVGIDNLNSYYDPTLKIYRLDELDKAKPAGINYRPVRGDISDKATIDGLFEEYHFDVVVNLAAQVKDSPKLRRYLDMRGRASTYFPLCMYRSTFVWQG